MSWTFSPPDSKHAKRQDAIKRKLAERATRKDYIPARDGPADIALAREMGDLENISMVKEWCDKGGPEAASFAKTYLDNMHQFNTDPLGYFTKSLGGPAPPQPTPTAPNPKRPSIRSMFRNARQMAKEEMARQEAAKQGMAGASNSSAARATPLNTPNQPVQASPDRDANNGEEQSPSHQRTPEEAMSSIQDSISSMKTSRGTITSGLSSIADFTKVITSPSLSNAFADLQNPDMEKRAQSFETAMTDILRVLDGMRTGDESDAITNSAVDQLRRQAQDASALMREVGRRQGESAQAGSQNPSLPKQSSSQPGQSSSLPVQSSSLPSQDLSQLAPGCSLIDSPILEDIGPLLMPTSQAIDFGLYPEVLLPPRIRLLEVSSVPKSGPIQAYLHTVDLSDSPSYTALSYVWADPRHSLYQRNQVTEPSREYELICNGKKKMITTNLRNALATIFAVDDSGKSIATELGCDRIWVDQLCIDQGNTIEKSAQVANMGEIYTSAKGVICWLGAKDSHSEEAIKVTQALSSLSPQVYNDPSYDPVGEIKRFEPSWWVSMVVLLGLPYFQRAWIAQELALANNITMLWGSQRFEWWQITRAATFLFSTKAWTLLRRHVEAFKPTWDLLETQSGGLDYKRSLSAAIELHMKIKFHTALGSSPDSPFKLLIAGRALQAKDPRDKLFALANLAHSSARRLNVPFPEDFKADYSKSEEEVARQFAVEYMRAREDLSILLQVEDPGFRRLQKLPSWVPDFTVPLLPPNLTADTAKKWRTDGGTKLGFKIIATNTILQVHGSKLNTIKSVSPPFSEIIKRADWTPVLAQLDSCDSPAAAGDRLLAALLCTSSVLKMKKDSEERARLRRQFSDWIICKVASIREKVFEVPNAAILLVTKEIDDLMEFAKGNIDKLVDPDPANRPALPQMSTSADTFNNFWGGHKGPPNSKEFVSLENATRDAIARWHKDNPDGFFPDATYVRETLEVLQRSSTSVAEADKYRSRREVIEDSAKKFEVAMGSNLEGRALFCSSSGYLGLGPQSMKPGTDEIWAISGVSVPMVLRPKRLSGARQSYTVVGHCYLPNRMLAHGDMQGPDYFKPIFLR